MSLFKQCRIVKNKNKALLSLVQFLVLTFLIINCWAHGISMLYGIKLFFYQAAAWFIVGYAILVTVKIRMDKLTEVIALSYGAGGIVSLLVYFAFVMSGAKDVLPYFTFLEAFGACFILYKKKVDIERYETDLYGLIVCFFLLFIYYCFSVLTVSFVNTLPNETGGGGYYDDWGFWAGNNIGFTKGFPSGNFRQIGVSFAYHYFSSILMAQSSLCTGVDINLITFYFSNIFGGIFLIFSAYYFATRILKENWSVFIFMVASLFTNGLYVTFTWHILICPFGFDYGYAYGMIALGLLSEIFINDRFKDLFPLSCVFLAMTVGCKGAIASLILVAYGVAALSIFIRKDIKKGLLSGFLWLVSFCLVYYTFIMYHDGHLSLEDRAGYIESMDLDTIVTTSDSIKPLYKELLSDYKITGDRFLVKIYSIWLYMYRANKVIAVLLFFTIVKIIYDLIRKRSDVLSYCFVIASLTGIGLAIYMNMKGSSQMYFVMGMYPMAAMAGIHSLEKWKGDIAESAKLSYVIYQGAILVMLCTLGISVDSYIADLIPKIRSGVSIIRGKYTQGDYVFPYVDTTDYEAFIWMKDNTPEDAVFAIDSFMNTYGQEMLLMTGVFSERYVWNEQEYVRVEEAERRSVIMSGLDSDIESTLEILREEGVDYLVSSLSPDKPEYALLTDSISEVFRNAHYVIYYLNP